MRQCSQIYSTGYLFNVLQTGLRPEQTRSVDPLASKVEV